MYGVESVRGSECMGWRVCGVECMGCCCMRRVFHRSATGCLLSHVLKEVETSDGIRQDHNQHSEITMQTCRESTLEIAIGCCVV